MICMMLSGRSPLVSLGVIAGILRFCPLLLALLPSKAQVVTLAESNLVKLACVQQYKDMAQLWCGLLLAETEG